jgi:hypothetical protein
MQHMEKYHGNMGHVSKKPLAGKEIHKYLSDLTVRLTMAPVKAFLAGTAALFVALHTLAVSVAP